MSVRNSKTTYYQIIRTFRDRKAQMHDYGNLDLHLYRSHDKERHLQTYSRHSVVIKNRVRNKKNSAPTHIEKADSGCAAAETDKQGDINISIKRNQS